MKDVGKETEEVGERFKFENIPMGRHVKVNRDRIDFGE
mgnify:CR=1 FL=1